MDEDQTPLIFVLYHDHNDACEKATPVFCCLPFVPEDLQKGIVHKEMVKTCMADNLDDMYVNVPQNPLKS